MVLQKKTSISLMLVAVSVIVMSSMGASYAQQTGMSITATAQDGSNTIKVTVNTVSKANDVTILVESPTKNVIEVAQYSPGESGMIEEMIRTDGIFWNQDGFYTITAQQGDASLNKLSVRVQVVGGTTFETMVTQSTFENTMIGGSNNVVSMDGLEITADAMEGSDTITIIGKTDRMQFPITLEVIAPNGNIISVDQVSPTTDGTFLVDIMVGGSLWSQDGDYTITAQQGENPNYKDSVQVEILDGLVVPEFGTIAALILAVAIVSIIAVSARSRLSIMPKY